MLSLKAELERGCSDPLRDPIPGALLAGVGVSAAYLPQDCPALCQRCCSGPREVTRPQQSSGAFLGSLLQGRAGLCSPPSQPAIAHPCCKGKIRGCVSGRGRWRQWGSKLGTT